MFKHISRMHTTVKLFNKITLKPAFDRDLLCVQLKTGQSLKTTTPTSGVAWHTPVPMCIRLKIEIQKLEKANKLKNSIKSLLNGGQG